MTISRLVLEPLEKAMHGARMTMRAGPAKPKAPAAPAPPPDPAMNPGAHGAIPPTPGQRVKFNHPATGEETEGHIHAQGGQGATVVDGQGATHRVPHGSYMHVHDATPPGGGEVKPQAELVKQAARKHLELGPSAPLAIYATAALLSIGGVKTVHELNASDVRIKGGCLYVDQDKLKTDDPAVVQMVQQLQHNSPKGPLFQVQGQPMTEQALTQYVKRFGTPQGAGPDPTPPAPMAKAQHPRVSKAIAKFVREGIPQEQAVAKALSMDREGRLTDEGEYIHADLHKASAAALILPTVPDTPPAARWQLGDYLVEFRKGRGGIGMVTVDGPGMPLPLHEIVSDPAGARRFATDAVAKLRKGEAPSRGVFQATR